ncbi:hypothetical protein SPRG_20255 [Saprolegnia parasitica CBS 223.65]|uniref:Pentacotripeptide-repeat region of PRORP domain-containing protein n=1 Tax=Saprolegnia parasitica (strain CBS 223.65) TaxID=695850 RepID=A0A067CFY9_SAPPC|nr:hypothetical protein SPRG_20255 [Saprolegnia parasitica CBS 223.65]KDO28095.1 hypothetical protein SPRG_20255 [Saprolegnia parasitica CBS 223.65]|eukprot:XP_012201239.1 hypothetical protein SPRG_20255 [Saprolegnia parasitica CBS 223.65]
MLSSIAPVHTNSAPSDDVEKAVAQATASLLARIAAMEAENVALKQQLQTAMKTGAIPPNGVDKAPAAPTITEPKKTSATTATKKTSVTTAAQKMPATTELKKTPATPAPKKSVATTEPVTAKRAEVPRVRPAAPVLEATPLVDESTSLAAPEGRKLPSNKFFFRLMHSSKTMQISPTLRAMLSEMDLYNHKWEINEIPAVMNCLVLLDRVPEALAFAKKWINSLTMLNHLMGQAARVKCPKLALGLLQLGVERNYAIDELTYNKCIVACARGPPSYLSTIEHLVTDMQEHGHRPNDLTFGALVVAAARLDHWSAVGPTLDMMDELPYDERVAAYSTVLVRLGREDHHEFCYRLFKHTITTGLSVSEDAVRVVVASCGKIARRVDALEVLDAISLDSIVSLKTFNALIAALANLDPTRAFEVFGTLQSRPNLELDIYTVNSVLLACVRARSFDEGVELFESRPVPFDNVTICTMLQLCGQAKQHAKATEIFGTALTTLPPSRQLYEEYFEALVESDVGSLAIEAFWRARENDTKFQPTLKMLNCLLRACHASTEHLDVMGQRLLDVFENANHTVSSVSVNHQLSLLIAANKLDAADEWLNTMRARGLVTYFSYQQLMVAYYDRGEYDKCLEVYGQCRGQRIEMLQQVKWKPYAFPRTGLVLLAQRAYYALGDWDSVVAMAPTVKGRQGTLHPWLSDRGCQELLMRAILAHEQRGDWEACVALYSKMVSVGMNDTDAYQATVRAVAKAGEFEAALDVNGGEWYRNERTSKGWFTPSDDDAK